MYGKMVDHDQTCFMKHVPLEEIKECFLVRACNCDCAFYCGSEFFFSIS